MVAKINPAGQTTSQALLEAHYRPSSTMDAEGLSSTTQAFANSSYPVEYRVRSNLDLEVDGDNAARQTFYGPTRWIATVGGVPNIVDSLTDFSAANSGFTLLAEDIARPHTVVLAFDGFDAPMGFSLEIVRHFEATISDNPTEIGAAALSTLDMKYSSPMDILRQGNHTILYRNPIAILQESNYMRGLWDQP